MKNFLAVLLAAAFSGLALFRPASLWASEEVLRISGSTTVLPIAQRAAEYFMGLRPAARISVSGTGSGEGLKALLEGATDIATSSRDLKAREIARLKEHGVSLTRHTVAVDCLAVVVHPDNPVDGLSLAQLKGLYDGSLQNWREVGGVDKKVIAINRDVSSGTFETWLEMVLKGARFRADAQMQTSSGGVSYAVSGNRYAIGYLGLGYVTPKVKVLAVDGLKPSPETVRDGRYPLARELYMFTRPDPPQTALDFIGLLGSPAGRRLVEQEGFIPVEKSDHD
ncbi:MAG: phosphate ABC transporter substrate-binding protein [Candidatus Adiutrix sp.]|jgi:phosphate transport system substrate-binding protein|nr:phosphate ABC transporter substrate-binding protein [Candidatus Adiutrix sp.]